MINSFTVSYIVSVVVFLIIDGVWLGVVARNLYATQLGHVLAENPNWVAAGVFYLLFLVGLQLFAIQPALVKQSLMHAVQYGALFGLMTYATYDLTNLATIKDWSLQVTIIDMIWGTVLSGSVSALTFLVVRQLGWN